jgi:uncharacterized protein
MVVVHLPDTNQCCGRGWPRRVRNRGNFNDGKLDVETVGAVISTGLGSSEVMGRELSVGVPTQSMVEFDNGVLVMGTLGKDSLLCLVCQAGAHLGNVRLQMKKKSPDLASAL